MIDLLWQAFLRRFDIEHTFRLFKQTLGWACPKVRTAEQADRWGWLVVAAYTQLRLARRLTADLRRPRGETGPAGSADTGSGSSRVSAPARTGGLSSQCTETVPAWSGTADRSSQRPTGHPL